MRSPAYLKFVLGHFISSSNQSQFRRLTDYRSVASDFLYNWPWCEIEINQWSQLQQHKDNCFKHLNLAKLFSTIRGGTQGPYKSQVSMLEPSLVLPYLLVAHAWLWALYLMMWRQTEQRRKVKTVKGSRVFEI